MGGRRWSQIQTESAVQYRGADFRRVAARIDSSISSASMVLSLVDRQIAHYGTINRGPTPALLATSGRRLVEAGRRFLHHQGALAQAFRMTAAELDRLAGMAQALHRQVVATDQAIAWAGSQLLSDSLFPLDYGPTQARLVSEFDRIRARQDRTVEELVGYVQSYRRFLGTARFLEWDGEALGGVLIGVQLRSAGRSNPSWGGARFLLSVGSADGSEVDYWTLDPDLQAAILDLVEVGGLSFDQAQTWMASGRPDFVVALAQVVRHRWAQVGRDGVGGSAESVLKVIEQTMLAGAARPAWLPEQLLPEAYLELKDLELQRNGALEDEFQSVDGWPLVPDLLDWTEDSHRRDSLRASIGANENRQQELRHLLSIGGRVGEGQVARMSLGGVGLAMAAHAGASSIWSARLGTALREELDERYSERGQGVHRHYLGLAEIGDLIDQGGAVAVEFYNQLGVDGAVDLVTRHYQPDSDPAYVRLADGLGRAAATGRLEFDGADFVAYGLGEGWYDPRVGAPLGVDGELAFISPVQFLAITSHLPDQFLAEAGAEVLKVLARGASAAHHTMGVVGPYVGLGVGDPNSGVAYHHPAMVLLEQVAERSDDVARHLIARLGLDRADALVRFSSPFDHYYQLQQQTDHQAVIARVLYQAQRHTEEVDGRPAQEAVRWLITAAAQPGGSKRLELAPGAAVALDVILMDRPSVMVNVAGEDLAASGGVAGWLEGQLSGETVDRAIEAVFASGAGGALLHYRSTLVPALTAQLIDQVRGDLTQLVDPYRLPAGPLWVGEVINRIDTGQDRARLNAAHDQDARNQLTISLLATSAGWLTGLSVPDPSQLTGVAAGLAVGQVAGRLLATDSEMEVMRELLAEGNLGWKLPLFQMAQTLMSRGYLQLPDGDGLVGVFESDAYSRVMLVDPDRGPLTDREGQPLTLWSLMALNNAIANGGDLAASSRAAPGLLVAELKELQADRGMGEVVGQRVLDGVGP